MILGIDEVGRGPWAGPLVMGAVVLGCEIEGLTDSKKLTQKRREVLDKEIRDRAMAVGLGWVQAEEIDTLGLGVALQLACKRAVKAVDTLGVAYHEIIIDGTINFLKDTPKGRYVTTIKKADLLVPSVSAASIVAKVARDQLMYQQDEYYPDYGFKSHVGYGTAKHRAAIERFGVTPLHRLSFAPLAKYRHDGEVTSESTKVARGESPKTIGDRAEDVAALYLERHGHTICERNWKTKYCEIDIVSQKGDQRYFTEVKYRRQPNQGGGLAAITAKKLAQMRYAATFYAHTYKLTTTSLIVSGIALTGTPPEVTDYIEIID